MCGFRLYVIFLDRQFSNELASLDTHPRRSLSALLIPFCCIVFYVFIHVRCDSHMSLVMRSSFQVCLPPCMCIWSTDFYFLFCFCRRRSVTHRACQPCISILMPWACQPGIVFHVLLSFSATAFECVRVCAYEAAYAILICCKENQIEFRTRFPGHAVLVLSGVCDGSSRRSRDDRTRSLGTCA